MIRLLKRAAEVLFTDIDTGEQLDATAAFHLLCGVATAFTLLMLCLQLSLRMGG